jgi:hypothetical protein
MDQGEMRQGAIAVPLAKRWQCVDCPRYAFRGRRGMVIVGNALFCAVLLVAWAHPCLIWPSQCHAHTHTTQLTDRFRAMELRTNASMLQIYNKIGQMEHILQGLVTHTSTSKDDARKDKSFAITSSQSLDKSAGLPSALTQPTCKDLVVVAPEDVTKEHKNSLCAQHVLWAQTVGAADERYRDKARFWYGGMEQIGGVPLATATANDFHRFFFCGGQPGRHHDDCVLYGPPCSCSKPPCECTTFTGLPGEGGATTAVLKPDAGFTTDPNAGCDSRPVASGAHHRLGAGWIRSRLAVGAWERALPQAGSAMCPTHPRYSVLPPPPKSVGIASAVGGGAIPAVAPVECSALDCHSACCADAAMRPGVGLPEFRRRLAAAERHERKIKIQVVGDSVARSSQFRTARMLVALLKQTYPHADISAVFGLDGHGAGEGGFGPEHAFFCSQINTRFAEADMVLVQYHAFGFKDFAEGYLRQLCSGRAPVPVPAGPRAHEAVCGSAGPHV